MSYVHINNAKSKEKLISSLMSRIQKNMQCAFSGWAGRKNKNSKLAMGFKNGLRDECSAQCKSPTMVTYPRNGGNCTLYQYNMYQNRRYAYN